MRTSLILTGLLLLAAPLGSAASGYLETFNDGNDPGNGNPVGEPTTWYSFSSNQWKVLHGSIDSICSQTPLQSGIVSCTSGSGTGAVFLLASPLTTGDYDINFTAQLHRNVNTHLNTVELDILDNSNVLRGIYEYKYSGTSTATYHKAFGAGGCDHTDTQTIAPTTLDVSTPVHIHYNSATTTLSITDDGGTSTCVGAIYTSVKSLVFVANSLTAGAEGARDYSDIDDLVWNPNNGATYSGPTTPTAPAGLTAFVSKAFDGSESNVELRWPLSSNDPNQTTGNFTYHVFVNGVDIGADPITGQDGEGARYNLVVITGTAGCGDCAYWIVAEDRGIFGPKSCTASVDDTIQDDLDACGDTSGLSGTPGGLGDTAHTTATDTAAGLKGFCSSLMGDSTGSLFLCGLILMATVFLAVAAAFAVFSGGLAMPAMLAGSIFGVGEGVFNVVAGIWNFGAAILFAIIGAGIIASAWRRFMAGRGGPDE